MKEIVLTANDAGQRLDRFLKKYLANAPLSYIYKLMRGSVKVNGKRQKENYALQEGDVLQLYIADSELEAYTKKKKIHSAKRQFTIVYEDDNLIIVNKPFGLLVHGDQSEKKNTLANQVTDYLIETGAYNPRAERSFVPSPVHRLDRNTTGLVVFGKNAEALRILSLMFREDGYVRKFYATIVYGCLDKELHLKNKLVKFPENNKVKVYPVDYQGGKYIETIVRPLYAADNYSLQQVELVTGRSHQIRAHLSFAGHPVIGDSKYGGREYAARQRYLENNFALSTQLLHAQKLIITKAPGLLSYLEGKEFKAEIPQGFKDIEKALLGREIDL